MFLISLVTEYTLSKLVNIVHTYPKFDLRRISAVFKNVIVNDIKVTIYLTYLYKSLLELLCCESITGVFHIP